MTTTSTTTRSSSAVPQNERSGPHGRPFQNSTIGNEFIVSTPLDLVKRCLASVCRAQDFIEDGEHDEAHETLRYVADDLDDAVKMLVTEAS